jgi:hypothetical protein
MLIPRGTTRALDDSQPSPFHVGPEIRPLRLILDTAELAATHATELLLELAPRKALELITTDRRDGAFLLEIGNYRVERDYFEVTYEHSGGVMDTGLPAGRRLREVAEEESRETGVEAEQALSALCLLGVAEAIGADGLVTKRADALGTRWASRRAGARVLADRQALALAGLVLRTHGDYTWKHFTPAWGEYIPRYRYFVIAARHLLPTSWRWAHAASQHFAATARHEPLALADSALDRVARALRIRDLLLAEDQRPAGQDTAFEVRRHFDALLLTLSGAFDATARVAHHVYQLPDKQRRQASWRLDAWLSALADQDSRLASLWDPGTRYRDVFHVLGQLRNTIHGAALSDSGFVDLGGPTVMSIAHRNAVVVPDDVFADILESLERLGGAADFGFDLNHVSSVDAVTFCETALPLAVDALNTTIGMTDVTRLAGVDVSDLATGPPPGVPAHHADERQRWVSLLGLELEAGAISR